MKQFEAIERHRTLFPNKSDEWLFERLDNELKQKVETIHELLSELKQIRDEHSEMRWVLQNILYVLDHHGELEQLNNIKQLLTKINDK